MWTMEDTRNAIPVLCGIITLIICIRKLVIRGKSPNQKFIEKAKENGCVVEAVLLDTWINSGDHDSKIQDARYSTKHAIYEYYVDGKKYTAAFSAKIYPGKHPIFPNTRTLYYKKGNPKKSISEGQATEAARMERGCLLSILYTIIVTVAVGRLLLWIGLI